MAPQMAPQVQQPAHQPRMHYVPNQRPNTPFHQPASPGFSSATWIGSVILIISILGLILNSVGTPYTSTYTPDGFFTCDDGETIIQDEVGDGDWGCDNGEDEDAAAYSKIEFWTHADKDDIEDQFRSVEDRTDAYLVLYETPATCFTLGIITGILLIALDFSPTVQGVKSILRLILLASTSLIGLFLLISGTSWFGRYLTYIMSVDGDINFHLSVMPYYFTITGVLLALWPLKPIIQDASFLTNNALRDDRTLCFGLFRLAKRTLFASALCLILVPLLPVFSFNSTSPAGDETAYFGPLEMEAQYDYLSEHYDGDREPAEDEEAGWRVINNWGKTHWLTWLIMWSSLGFLAVSLFTENPGTIGRVSENIFQIHGLLIIPVITGIVFTIIMYVSIPQMESSYFDYSVAFNWFMPLAYLYLLIIWFSDQLPKTLLPWIQTMQAAQMQAGPMQAGQMGAGQMPPAQEQIPAGVAQLPYDPSRRF